MGVDRCSSGGEPEISGACVVEKPDQLLLGATHLGDARADRFGRSACCVPECREQRPEQR
jgi:hypothetical protein